MGTFSGTRALNICGDAPFLTYTEVREDIILIAEFAVLVIEIGTKEVNSVVFKDGINADDILLRRIFIQVAANDRFLKWDKLPEWAALTLVLMLYTPIRPSVSAYRLITSLARLGYKALRKHIFPTSEQTLEYV